MIRTNCIVIIQYLFESYLFSHDRKCVENFVIFRMLCEIKWKSKHASQNIVHDSIHSSEIDTMRVVNNSCALWDYDLEMFLLFIYTWKHLKIKERFRCLMGHR